jgi:hypothetical protein
VTGCVLNIATAPRSTLVVADCPVTAARSGVPSTFVFCTGSAGTTMVDAFMRVHMPR